ncbi:MAG: GNAT family N-acetyltransferase [Mycobacteriales bacterium]
MLRAPTIRVLEEGDRDEAATLLSSDPVTNVFVAARIEALGFDPWRLGAEVWGYMSGGALTALCYAGANLVPVHAEEPALRAFADRARRQGRRCSSIFGAAAGVLPLWRMLRPTWGEAREVREVQPLLAIERPSLVPPDPAVRRVRPDELDLLLPSCIAMFTEEVGVSPVVGDMGGLYRTRIAELIAAGRAFARIEDGEVLFKAEIGAATCWACQIQGVWVRPDLRGKGLGAAGTATVVDTSLAEVAPVVSLYVNEFNVPARRAYERIGFARVGTFASVLF